jgi:hypothetical protein
VARVFRPACKTASKSRRRRRRATANAVESALDVETSVEPPDDVPLEAAPADWQEQLEAVELFPELDDLHRDDF